MNFNKRILNRLLTLWRVSGQAGAKSRIKQIIEMVWIVGTCEFSPGEYWVYGFHMRDKSREEIRQYLPAKIYFSQVIPIVNNKKAHIFLENKWMFFLHFREQLVSTPLCYGVFHPISGFSSQGKKLASADDLCQLVSQEEISSFIAKPVSGINGRDILKIDVDLATESICFLYKEEKYDAKAIVELLSERVRSSRNCGFLLQECVKQHKAMEELSPSACMNVRIITIKDPAGIITVTSTSARIGRLGSVVSNAGSGGLLAHIDPKSGIISGCKSSIYIDAEEVFEHPDTGHQLVGERLPFWEESVKLCVRAADLVPDVSSIGWDVLVKDEGPILLEGNHDWGILSEQSFGKGYLNNGNREIFERFGLKFNYFDEPKFRLRKVLQFLN